MPRVLKETFLNYAEVWENLRKYPGELQFLWLGVHADIGLLTYIAYTDIPKSINYILKLVGG